LSKQYYILAVIFSILYLLSLSPGVHSTIEANIIKTRIINYPNNAEYYGFGTRSYIVYDYDKDGYREVILVNIVNGMWVKGSITILNSTGIEKYKFLTEFTPYKVFVYDELIGVIGFYTNSSTYGVALFNNDLHVVDKYVLNQEYPIPTSVFVIPDKPLVYNGRVFFNIIPSYENNSYTDLVVLEPSKGEIRVYARTYNVIIESSPRAVGDLITWGPLIIDANDLSLRLNLTTTLNLTNKTIYDTILADNNRLYLVYGSFPASINESSYLAVYDLDNNRYYLHPIPYSTSKSLYIARFNHITDKLYLSTTDVFNILTTIGTKIYLVYKLCNITGGKLDIMISINTSRIGYVFNNDLLYLISDNKLYIINPTDLSHAIVLLENLSTIRATIVEPIVLEGNSEKSLIILSRTNILYVTIQLNIKPKQPRITQYPLNEKPYIVLLVMTIFLFIITLKNKK